MNARSTPLPPPSLRLARVLAAASLLTFIGSLLVMTRWILLLDHAPADPLPAPADAVLPLIALTVASFAAPVLLLSLTALIPQPDAGARSSGNTDTSTDST